MRLPELSVGTHSVLGWGEASIIRVNFLTLEYNDPLRCGPLDLKPNTINCLTIR